MATAKMTILSKHGSSRKIAERSKYNSMHSGTVRVFFWKTRGRCGGISQKVAHMRWFVQTRSFGTCRRSDERTRATLGLGFKTHIFFKCGRTQDGYEENVWSS